ncbi:DUF378 domain-containing protein [Paenibacillus yanchengensis]|uniref:DUF378 domain-containing protein n=1 Tax=Paenibacillus yanchengensis TaxID=2035833 RepID=A0ABW4YJT1_9BACL
MKTLDGIALALVIVGGINWLFVGLFQLDLVAALFAGSDTMMARIVYTLVGIAALYSLKFFGWLGESERAR